MSTMGQDPLEYSILKEYIKPYLASEIGLGALERMAPCPGWDEAKKALALMAEMMDALASWTPLEVPPVPDIRPLLGVREGAVLEGQDLLKVAEALKAVSRIRHDLEARGGLLSELAAHLDGLPHVSAEICSVILPTGEVSGDACPELRDLRNRARSVRAAILERLEAVLERLRPRSVLMEDLVTMRNERYVIPVRHDYHLHIKGITHDYSRTNRTVYVEPLEIVEENNTLNQIRAQIVEEEQRVLRELTSLVATNSETIRRDLDIYARVDLMAACARWALKWDCSIPEIRPGDIDLAGARHPVLLERLGGGATVPVDIRMPEGHDCLIITGPNAGGKTVALKTLGLIVLMAKSGLAVPVRRGSRLPPVGEVWVEMDTGQDITHDLSSFTAQAVTLKRIYENAHRGDLVLLDEPGSGTDHEQGGALAVACIEALRAKGAYVVVTSHADLVKLYGITAQGVQNAAAAFDETGMRPLYTLEYGMVGTSRAFEILEAIAFPKELIDQARGIANRDATSALARAIDDISRASAMREEASRMLEEAARARDRARAELERIRRERVEYALRYRRTLARLEDMARRSPRPEAVQEVRRGSETQEVEEILDQVEAPARTLSIEKGSRVRIRGSDMEGVVVDVQQDTVEVSLGAKRVRLGLDQVAAEGGGETGQTRKLTVKRMSMVPTVMPVKVVGMRVDEALPVVEKALDRALLAGQEVLEIIHGTGTGRLKKAIREFLKGLPYVKDVRDASLTEGGGNKTIVTLAGGD